MSSEDNETFHIHPLVYHMQNDLHITNSSSKHIGDQNIHLAKYSVDKDIRVVRITDNVM